jgi:hypothetical protein
MAGDRDRDRDGPEAEKRLKAILAIAIASLEIARTPEPVVKRDSLLPPCAPAELS